MDSFFDRLKQRKVFQWVFAYVAGAWVTVQVMDVVAEPWGLAAGLLRGAQALLALGLPIVLVLSWYHGEKGRQRVSRPEFMILASLFLLAGGVLAVLDPLADTVPAAVAREQPRLSLAVLPFDNLSPDPDHAYFADGVHEDVMTQLSRVQALTVTSRTSVMSYRETEQSLVVIGAELGVGTILEGSVRRAGDMVRITAQLIDALSDSHIWADDFDRTLTASNVFAIQTEIAQRIAEALEATLAPEEERRIARRPTDDFEAYDLFLRGRQAYIRLEADANEEAVDLFKQAIEVDPLFAEPYAGLAEAYMHRVQNFGYPGLWLDSVLVQAQRAIDLDPEGASGYNSLGTGYALKGFWSQALEEFREAVRLDPKDHDAAGNLGVDHAFMGRPDEAMRWIERSVRLNPEDVLHQNNRLENYLALGATSIADSLYREMSRRFADHPRLERLAYWIPFARGDFAAALELLGPYSEANPQDFGARGDLALVAFLAGDIQEAIETLESIPPEARDVGVQSMLGYVLVQAGRRDEGLTLLEEARMSLTDRIEEGQDDPGIPWGIAGIHSARGETEQALEWAERAHQAGYLIGWHRIQHDPMMDNIRDDPRYQAISRASSDTLEAVRLRLATERVEQGR